MKISAIRKLLILLDLVLFLGVGGSIYQAVETKKEVAKSERERLQRLNKRKNLTKGKEGPRFVQRSYTQLIDGGGALFASQKPPPKEVETKVSTEVDIDKTPLEEKAELVSISSGGSAPYAYIKPKGMKEVPPGEQRFFAENEALPFVDDAVVKKILARSVVFMHLSKEVILVLSEGTSKTAADAPAGVAVVPLKDWPSGITTTKGSALVEITYPAILGMKEAGSDEVLKGVVWSTVKLKDGKPAVQVKTVPSGGALHKGGLRSGDTIKSINGTRVTSKAEIVRYVKANPNLARYTVVYIRSGATHTRTVTPKR